jgi:hypothetical protein
VADIREGAAVSLWDRLWSRSPAAPASAADKPANPDKPAKAVQSLPNLSAQSPAARRSTILATSINPALGWLSLRGVPSDDRARVMMLAITGQEADAQFRRQHGNGPARGLWQFERGGGVAGVLSHRSSARLAAALCEWRGVEASTTAVHPALERDDVLAAGFARLLLWTDAKPLPSLDAEDVAWAYYLRNWRPGKPHPATWPGHWRMAREVVAG